MVRQWSMRVDADRLVGRCRAPAVAAQLGR